jgi:hypothetical protein
MSGTSIWKVLPRIHPAGNSELPEFDETGVVHQRDDFDFAAIIL